MSVIMSVMKTAPRASKKKKPAAKANTTAKPLPKVFTVRDMNRNTSTVLAAARQHGKVTIRSRAGEEFNVESVKPVVATDILERLRLHHERMAELGNTCGPNADVERHTQVIAGEI